MITESAVHLRLDPTHWPETLDRKELSAPFEMNQAIEEARAAFYEFLEMRSAQASSGRLTPVGMRAAGAEWAGKRLPPLRNRLTKIRDTAAKVETSLIQKLTAELTEPATDPADVALMQEIRSWLRSLPEEERLRRAQRLANDGDKSALRAMLTAPVFLTGVNAELLAAIRDDAARRAHPERHAKLETFRKAVKVAEGAVDGVIRFLVQESVG